ncbi:Transcriptional repressor TCF25 [Teratosphaeria destructans]|uniref:Transcriptional repressor TCF25 n=1 Tax=Teratosphaeria destructans TaxID=418781 RepID=A0A9W7SRJ5_9PEZI|nr:Transcriptional repressor TCF25 [Teratosphaeria destructans]
MSSRALRKAQREKEEREQKELEEDEADHVPAQRAKKSAFELLDEKNDEDEDDDDDEDGGAALDPNDDGGDDDDDDDDPPSADTAAPAPAPTTSSKKKKKKKKKKGKTSVPVQPETELDEIDQALKQLSTSPTPSHAGATSGGVDPSVNETCRLLAVDTSHLHAQNEMRRLFGRAALDQHDDDDDAPTPATSAQPTAAEASAAGRAGPGRARTGRGGSEIGRAGKEDWPVATGGGLGMDVEEKRADGTVLYRFVHNRAYQDVQSQFESCVESMDPNRLVVLLQHNPYHISTLLQVSEIAKQERDHATAGDLLERALFSFGRANLSMRATWRTVYEWAKLLLSLSPDDDPYALWLVLDQYALRSRQDLDYLNLSRNATFKAVHQNMLNVQLSQGLAEYRSGNKSKGQQALFTAIGRFPWVVARLMQELAIDPPPAIWGKEPRTDKEKMHTELYAVRGKDLWNTPETSALLTEIASALPPDMPPAEPDGTDITPNEARHVLLSDTPALIALLPRTLSAQLTSVSDPLPPATNHPSYTTSTSQNPVDTDTDPRHELEALTAFLSALFPWFRPAHVDGGDDAAMPSEDEIARSIRESGVSRRTIVQRLRRLVLLQARVDGGAERDWAALLLRRAGEEA